MLWIQIGTFYLDSDPEICLKSDLDPSLFTRLHYQFEKCAFFLNFIKKRSVYQESLDLLKDGEFLSVKSFSPFFNGVDLDPCLNYRFGSTKLIIADLIWIRIHNT